MIRFLLLIFFLSVAPVAVLAQASEDVTVTQRILSGDTIPPTTPGPLTVSLVTQNQISLTWGASTDNNSVGGYQVFRDATQIAITTLNTYTDSGLTSSTTYSYYIVAFDNDDNYSSSSNSISTSTSARVIAGRLQRVELIALYVEPSLNSVDFSWETDRYARYELRWGETLSYERGFVANQSYDRQHQTILTDLESNTTYLYELVAYDRSDNRFVLAKDKFRTLAEPDITPPPNISRFRADIDDNDVVLRWENPSSDFKYVRIVRNPLFYPSDPNDGYVIHQGTGERHVDKGVLDTYGAVYYTAFSYDEAGNRSSGATVFVTRTGGGDAGSFQNEVSPGQATSTGTTSPEVFAPLSISIDDITIIQSGERINAVDGSFVVDTSIPFTISAPYDIFPEHLKAIQITLAHPFDDSISYSYLLRINSDKTAYEALIDNLGFSGTIPLRLAVYDYQTSESAIAKGSIITRNLEPIIEIVRNITPWYSELWLPIILLLLILWWFLFKRRDEDEDKPPVRFA